MKKMIFAPVLSTDPKDSDLYEERPVSLKDGEGKNLLHVNSVRAPKSWSDSAVMIAARTFLRKKGIPQTPAIPSTDAGAPEGFFDPAPPLHGPTGPETDFEKVFHRLAGCWTHHGLKLGLLHPTTAHVFYRELMVCLRDQIASPNSPQWFNTGLHWAYGIKGTEGSTQFAKIDGVIQPCQFTLVAPQCHACFIFSVDDDLVGPNGILNLWLREASVFKFGSGSGVNPSKIRGKGEPMSQGGQSSGLMSFLGVGDRSAGAIKSAGTTRRAAKMVCVDIDHPDIREFIRHKATEEDKVAALVVGQKAVRKHFSEIQDAWLQYKMQPSVLTQQRLQDAITEAKNDGVSDSVILGATGSGSGYWLDTLDYGWESEAYLTVGGQNANNSVRVSNDFMEKVSPSMLGLTSQPWDLIARTTGEPIKTVEAQDLWNELCAAARKCADPGLQYDTTINEWHTCPRSGRIRASNPCVSGSTRILCVADDGELYEKRIDLMLNKPHRIWSDGKAYEVTAAFWTGTKKVIRIGFENTDELVVTPDHLVTFLPSETAQTSSHFDAQDVPARQLRPGDMVQISYFGKAAYPQPEPTPNPSTWHNIPSVWGVVESVEELAEEQDVYDLTVPETQHFVANGYRVHNCSEYMFLDDTACNLASLNLIKFLRPDGTLDLEKLEHVIRLWTVVLEISVEMAGYPTKHLAHMSHRYRTLGLGYTNLGSLLVHLGIPYGQDGAGDSLVRGLYGLLSGAAYRTSCEMAEVLGPFPGYVQEDVDRVLHNHWEVLKLDLSTSPLDGRGLGGVRFKSPASGSNYKNLSILPPVCPARHSPFEYVVKRAELVFSEVCSSLQAHGVRNAQVSVSAPTGTIGLQMDCLTTGIEPMTALTYTKYLAGGGTMEVAGALVREYMSRFGIEGRAQEIITGFLARERHLEFDAQTLKEILDCQGDIEAVRKMTRVLLPAIPHKHTPTSAITAEAHLRVMAAAQPLISGAISKSVNLPVSATVKDVSEVYYRGWNLGLKALAIYVDCSKNSQPLSVEGELLPGFHLRPDPEHRPLVEVPPLPGHRTGQTVTFEVDGHRFHLTVNESKGKPIEIFLAGDHGDSSLEGFSNLACKLVSKMLRLGVGLGEVCSTLSQTSFEPFGYVDCDLLSGPDRLSKSIPNTVSKILWKLYGQQPKPQEVSGVEAGMGVGIVDNGVAPPNEQLQAFWALNNPNEHRVALLSGGSAALAGKKTGQLCPSCKTYNLVRTATCLTCSNCGHNTGCGGGSEYAVAW